MRLPPLAICGATPDAARNPDDSAIVVLMPDCTAWGVSKNEAETMIRQTCKAGTERKRFVRLMRRCVRPVIVCDDDGGLTVGELRGAWMINAKGGEA